MEYALQVRSGGNGWLRFSGPALGVPGVVYVRFGPDGRGRMRAREIYLDGEGDTIADLRKVPMQQLEATANQLAHDGLIQPDGISPADGLGVLASHFSTTFGSSNSARPDNWVAAAYFAQIEQTGPKRRVVRATAPPARPIFTGPGLDGLTDAFLKRMSDAYYYEVNYAGNRSPAKTLAVEAQASVKTVHKWIALARARGVMSAAKKGEAG